MDKILELLGIQNLDESKQTEVKGKLDTIVESKVLEGVKEKEEEIKNQLTEEYEEKFESYKTDITEKFSNFIDEVLDEEMEIPEKIVEFARKGELYEDVIETLKTKLAIDEGLIEDEVKDLLKESKEEISTLKEQTNKLTSENMELKSDVKEFAANIYLREKCEGLGLKQREKVLSLLEGITDKEKIDSKFDVIVETTEEETNDNDFVDGKGEDDPESKVNEETDDPMSNMMNYWNAVLNENTTK